MTTANNISTIVESLFPSFYKEEGPLFIQFVKAYYEWMEQQDNVLHHQQNLTNYFDIDKTIDEFLYQFKQQYMPDIDFAPETDRRAILKHAQEFLATKGTEEGFKLFFKLVFNQDVEIFYPKNNVLRASDGTWYEPKYLELKQSSRTTTFVGKNIVGSVSGASAFAERLVTKTVGGKKFDVLYISNIKGNFEYGEVITSDGLLDDCPAIIGSMTSIDVVQSGKDFVVGDVVDVISSSTGKMGRARVTAVGGATGRVLFNLVDGGYGFTTNATVYVSEKIVNLPTGVSKVPYTAPKWPYTDFLPLETIKQPMANISCIAVTANTLAVNTKVYGYYSNGTIATEGYIVGLTPFVSGSQTIKVNTTFGQPAFSQATIAAIGTAGNTVIGTVDTIQDSSATGLVVGTTSSSVGIANIVGTFTSNTSAAYVYGSLSNTYARIGSLSTGTGAGFDVGRLTNTERVYLNTDRIGANNTGGVPFLKVRLGAISNSSSNVGFVANVSISNPSANATHLFVSGGGTLYSDGQSVLFTGGTPEEVATGHISTKSGSIYSITVGTGGAGLGYTNSQAVSFNGGTPTVPASGYIVTNSTGGITSVVMTNTGSGYAATPTITIASNTASVANLIATVANGVIGSVVIDSIGYGYDTTPTVSVVGGTSGTAANLAVGVNYGYGFVKDPNADAKTILNDALTRGTFNIGTIDGLTDINLGSNYTQDPFVLVVEPTISGFNRRDIAINHDNTITNFIVGETVVQNFSNTQPVINYTNKNSSSYEVGEMVTQATLSGTLTVNTAIANTTVTVSVGNTQNISANYRVLGTGIPNETFVTSVTNTTAFVISNAPTATTNNLVITYTSNVVSAKGTVTELTPSTSTTGSFIVNSVTGTFTANTTPVIGMTTAAAANIASVVNTSILSAAKGIVKSSTPGSIVIARRSFNTSFAPNVPITGSVTGVSANIISIAQTANSMPIGINANIDAAAGIANGVIQAVEIVDSGFAYSNYESVELEKPGHPYVGSGYVNLVKQGLGEGYFTTERGFLNDTYNYLHDNDYWQEYSYEVRTGISLSRYADVLKKVAHIAGSKFFGSVVRTAELTVEASPEGNAAITTSDAILVLGAGNTYSTSEILRKGANTIGFANGSVQTSFRVPAAVNMIGNTKVYVPNTTAAQTTLTIDSFSYNGACTELITTANGVLVVANTTGLCYTNTYIVSMSNTQGFAVNDLVVQMEPSLLTALETANSDVVNTRSNVASYRAANNKLMTASAGMTRPYYVGGVYQGPLLERAATNLFGYSEDLSNAYWTKTLTSIVANDIAGPNDLQVADKILTTIDNAAHVVQRTGITVTAGQQYTLSCFFRAAEYGFAGLTLSSTRFGTDQTVNINLSTGATSILSGTPTVSVETYSNGWYRLGITSTATTTGSSTVYLRVANAISALTFAGSSTSGIHAFGCQMENGTLSSYIAAATAATARQADDITFTNAGWDKLTNKASGRIAAIQPTYLVINPSIEIHTSGSNNYPLTRGQTLVQKVGASTVTSGEILFSNASHIIATVDVGAYSKYFGSMVIANAEVASYLSNTAALTLGETVTQTIGANVVATGSVLSVNATHVTVANLSGHMVTSNNTNTTWLTGGTSGAKLKIAYSNTITASINATSRHISFVPTDYVVGSCANAHATSNVAHNVVAKLHTQQISIQNAINSVRVSSYYGGVKSGDTVVGNSSGSTAIVTNIQR